MLQIKPNIKCDFAEETLSKEGKFMELKNGVKELVDSARQLKTRHDSLNQEYQRLADRYSPQCIRVSK